MKLLLLFLSFWLTTFCTAQDQDLYDKNIKDIIQETPLFSIGLSLSSYLDVINKSDYTYILRPDAFLDVHAKYKFGGMLSTLLLMKFGKVSRWNLVLNLPIIDLAVKSSTTYNEELPLGFGGGVAYRFKPIYICLIFNKASYEKMTDEAVKNQNFPIAQNPSLSVGIVMPKTFLAKYMEEDKRFFINLGVIFTTESIKGWTHK